MSALCVGNSRIRDLCLVSLRPQGSLVVDTGCVGRNVPTGPMQNSWNYSHLFSARLDFWTLASVSVFLSCSLHRSVVPDSREKSVSDTVLQGEDNQDSGPALAVSLLGDVLCP